MCLQPASSDTGHKGPSTWAATIISYRLMQLMRKMMSRGGNKVLKIIILPGHLRQVHNYDVSVLYVTLGC